MQPQLILHFLFEELTVASRTIMGSFVEQVWVRLIPVFHRLHRRFALER